MTHQNRSEAQGPTTPSRREMSARQDALGRELRQLFDAVAKEDLPEGLRRLAERLGDAMEAQAEPGAPPPPREAGG